MITASYAFLPHIRVSVVIIFKSVGYNSCSGPVFNVRRACQGLHGLAVRRIENHRLQFLARAQFFLCKI
ncbi:hypothetical protein [Symbiopectobacterium sp. RP]|uniref:hypothetical protein n=1 Tax=Symbiopectobacterium sp. RP TaxID=3248553 RepID=UPI003D2E90F7